MLEALITSKTRIKLLLKFFLNPSISAHLRGLASEFGDSSNAIRLELNRLEDAGMIESQASGNKRVFQVNKLHPLYASVHQIVMKYVGVDEIIKNVVRGLGKLEYVYLGGDVARGKNSNVIDLVLIGDIDRQYLTTTVIKAEKVTGKKIKYIIYENLEEFPEQHSKDYFLIWNG